MAGPKKVAAPIDRPLSKAYLRQFGGWSTAYPPGLSEPATLREMTNVFITREGALRPRPGLVQFIRRDDWPKLDGFQITGSFEPFFFENGRKALLFAVIDPNDGHTSFRVAKFDDDPNKYSVMTLEEAGFEVDEGIDYVHRAQYMRFVQIDNKIFSLPGTGEPVRMFTVGETKRARVLQAVNRPDFVTGDKLDVVHPSTAWINGAFNTVPDVATPTETTLISSTAANNVYSFGYFYTFSNEIGETAASMVTVVKAQRRWSAWNIGGLDPARSTDQLVATIPAGVWDEAVASKAIRWNLYMLTWSDQDPVPTEGIMIGSREIVTGDRGTEGWMTHTPAVSGYGASLPLPSSNNRSNYTEPPCAGQGLVAGDRLVLVNDKKNAAVIRWSSNQQGEYTNFSPSVGGGYKTLTSGNLYIPAVAKLWQNPQSVDTITILCMGVDGYSTSYYMAPSSVSGQSQSTNIMGFEETTATPGTVSPYGCEVLNNALYHPLHSELMKSTASNYNISHKPVTDSIADKWAVLSNKDRIVSASLDNRLYYIVNNPEGEEVPPGCNGNEIWVCDTAQENLWCRWTIPAVSLRKFEFDGLLYMAVVKPDGVYVLDPTSEYDYIWGDKVTRPIPWSWETNTQGANRAHDAWVHLQQVTMSLSGFRGGFSFGITGIDINGDPVNVSRTVTYYKTVPVPGHENIEVEVSADTEVPLLIQRDMKEWKLWAHTNRYKPEEMPPDYEGTYDIGSRGQIDLVQYRYTPVTVNPGYEDGSIEALDYSRVPLTENPW